MPRKINKINNII